MTCVPLCTADTVHQTGSPAFRWQLKAGNMAGPGNPLVPATFHLQTSQNSVARERLRAPNHNSVTQNHCFQTF